MQQENKSYNTSFLLLVVILLFSCGSFAQSYQKDSLVRLHFDALEAASYRGQAFNDVVDSLNVIKIQLPEERQKVFSDLIQSLIFVNKKDVDSSLEICYGLLYGKDELMSEDSLMIHQNIALVLMELDDYSGAISHLKSGIKIIRGHNYRLNHLSDFITYSFMRIGQLDSAIFYIKSSADFRDQDLKGVNINVGNRYEELGLLDSASVYFKKALNLTFDKPTADDFMFIYCGLGNIFKAKGELDSALFFYKKAIADTVGMENMFPYVHANYNIAKIHLDRKEYDSCTYYMDRFFLCPCLDNESKVWLYEFKADYYKVIGREREYMYFQNLLMSAKDSVILELNNNLNSLSKLNVARAGLIEENLRIKNENNIIIEERSRLYLIGMILLFCLLVLGVSYLITRIKKNKEIFRIGEELMQSKVEGLKVAEENLRLELKSKNIDLGQLATKLTLRKEVMLEQKEMLKNLILIDDHKDLKKELVEQANNIENHQVVDGEISHLEVDVEGVNNKLFVLLKDKYSDLTKNDIQICGLHLLNLSTKEIAIIRNVTPKAIQVSRYRIKKKLGLSENQDLILFLEAELQKLNM